MSKNTFIMVKVIMQTINNYRALKKEKPLWNLLEKSLIIIGLATFLMLTIPQIVDRRKNIIYPEKIYLSIWETGKEIPLNIADITVPPINEIKENKPTILRFALTQDNFNPPQITKIFITFPPEADVSPIPYKGWTWERNNDTELTYFLSYPTEDIPVKGGLYNLPPFEIEFKEVKLLPFKYSIIGNKINPIERQFIINPELKYEDYLSRIFYDSGFDNSARRTMTGSVVELNTASPSVVEWDINRNTATPDVAFPALVYSVGGNPNSATPSVMASLPTAPPDVLKWQIMRDKGLSPSLTPDGTSHSINITPLGIDSASLGIIYIGIPKEALKKAGYTELLQKNYRKESNEEWITFLNWTTKEPDDLVTFYIIDGKVKSWKEK